MTKMTMTRTTTCQLHIQGVYLKLESQTAEHILAPSIPRISRAESVT